MPTTAQDQLGAQYKQASCNNQYEIVGGEFFLPVAESPPTDPDELASWSPVRIVRAHSPYRVRRVKWRHRKVGSPPVIPAPESAGAFTFISGAIEFKYPAIDASGSGFIWDVGGEYAFVETCRSESADGFVLGSEPTPSPINQALQQQIVGPPPLYGAVAQSGDDVKMGYAEGYFVSLGNGSRYTYWSPTFFPGAFVNTGMLNGEVTG